MKLEKTLLGVLLLSAFTLSAVDAAPDRPFSELNGVDLKIKILKMPLFPKTMEQEGIFEGHARIALDIDYTGELTDWIILEASHPSFALAIEQVVDDWRFSAPFINGENRSVVTQLDFDFRSQGTVVSFSSGVSNITRQINKITRYRAEEFSLSRIKDLDTRPYPIQQTPPMVSQEMIDKYNGTRAVFTFYVDEAGQVRIPVLSQTDGDPDPVMLLAAQDAISQWRFEPPTKNNKPAMIQLSQTFVFKN